MPTLSLRHPGTLGETHPLTNLKIVAASLVPFCCGVAIAWHARGAIDAGIALMTMLAIVAAASAISLLPAVHRDVAAFLLYGPLALLGSVVMQHAPITPVAAVDSFVLGVLIANVMIVNGPRDERTATLVSTFFTVAFALPIVWGIYAGPFRLTAVFFGVPLAIFSTGMLDRKHDRAPHIAETATLFTFVVTGLALAMAELLG